MATSTGAEPARAPPDALVRDVRAARRIVVLTGAGMSAESGIPTFRDALTGLWARFDPQRLATPDAFVRDPALVWGWYEARRRSVRLAEPNAGHRALHALQDLAGSQDLCIVTQNVDDLHERAGSRQVIHLHGSLFAPRCFECGREPAAAIADQQAADPADDGPLPPPHCIYCAGQLRPGVVWFGENLPEQPWAEAVAAAQAADLMLVVGTSAQVYPAAGLPDLVRRRGAPVWVINPEPPAQNTADGTSDGIWQTTAARGLPALAAALARA